MAQVLALTAFVMKSIPKLRVLPKKVLENSSSRLVFLENTPSEAEMGVFCFSA
jgi:hypothetical protein